jgi:DNA-binding CsgD family transcriptional regulator
LTAESLLEEAARLHEAVLDRTRWPETVRAVHRRLSSWRAKGALSPEQASWLESMIDCATRRRAEIDRLELIRAAAALASDSVALGIVVVDTDGRVLRANPEAERLLGPIGDTSISRGIPGGEGADEGTDLMGQLGLVSNRAQGTQSIPEAFRVARQGSRALEVFAMAIPAADDPFVLPDRRTVLFIADPDRDEGPDESGLMAAFDLTPAEARLATRLARGDGLKEAARALGIKTTTARTQLSRIFAKTGTSRQPELVRVLLSVPSTTRTRADR